MKKLFILSCVFVIAFACKEEPKDYVTLSGKITNKNSDSLMVRTREYSKTIKVNEDGTFKDTLKVETGLYFLYDGNESTHVFLKNGFDLNVTLDTKEFDESVKYTGNGAESSNYLAKKALMEETLYPPSLFDFEEEKFNSETTKIHNKLSSFLDEYKNIDSTLYSSQKKEIDGFKEGIFNVYKKSQKREQERAAQFAGFIGNPSPTFDNYENYKGGTTSLSDLKGKFVYVDIWATWCGPCKREIPFLKEVEEKYHDKNIEFVSISVDNGRGYQNKSVEASKEGWKKMIAEKEMGGIQLFSDNAWKSDFVQGYKVQGIPRFILIDPAGNVVNADAPRPSSPKLIKLLNENNI